MTGVMQQADDLVEKIERFEAQDGVERAANGGRLRVGARVRCELSGKVGAIETLDRGRFPLWPLGVRWEDRSFEFCSATELAVVEPVIANA